MSCDFDPAKVYNVETRKARKPHKCEECRGTIAVGERYEHVAGLWGRHWEIFHTCPDCVHIRCQLADRDTDGCGWIHGAMQDELSQADRPMVAAYNVSVAHRGGVRCDIYDFEEASS